MSYLSTMIDNAFAALIKAAEDCVEKTMMGNSRLPSGLSSCEAMDAEIESLESMTTMMQEKTAALHLQIQKRVAELRKRRNALTSPIRRLPPELFNRILFFAIDTSDFKRDGRDRTRSILLRVSWSWFQAVVSTPLLSSFLSNLHSIEKTTRYIRLSKNAPLSITCDDTARSRAETDEFMRLVLQHIHRWRSVNLQLAGIKGREWYLPTQSAPRLLEFEVFAPNKYYWANSELINLFNGDAPQLRVLNAQPFPITWDPVLFSGLTELTITDTVGEDADWGNRYMDLFNSLPLVEHLRIELEQNRLRSSHVIWPTHNTSEIDMEPICLPRLRSIWLNLPPRMGVTLLSSLITPSTHRVCIKANFLHASPRAVEKISFSKPGTLLSSITHQLTGLKIVFTASKGKLRLRGSYPTEEKFPWGHQAPLTLKFRPLASPLTPDMTLLINQLVSPSLTSFTIHGRAATKALGLDPASLFPHLPELETFSLLYNDSEEGIHDVFSALRSPARVLCSNGAVSDRWPCPKLKRLILDGVRFQPKHLRSLIQARYDAGSENVEASCVPLDEVYVSYCMFREYGEEPGLRAAMAEIGTLVQSQGGEFCSEFIDKCFITMHF
ncbi:hypothetical protein FRC03_012604 [Tulasnella sp. 419]|nr:hypothetical protein FRC03_012604 [Tulasnella sp. 419]